MECPPQGITFLPRTMALKLSTAASNTIKTWTDLLFRTMATTQLMNFNLPMKKLDKMTVTKSLFLKEDSFTGKIARALIRHNSPQPASLTMSCLTRFHWAGEAFGKSFHIFYCLIHYLVFIPPNFNWWYLSDCLRVFLHSIFMSEPSSLCLDARLSPQKISSHLLLESLTWTANCSDIMPWPHRTSLKQNLRRKCQVKQLSMGAHNHEQIIETFYLTFEILTETFFKVKIWTVENPLVVILIPITIQQKSSPASLGPLRSPKNWTT